jgi:hypothetical protein
MEETPFAFVWHVDQHGYEIVRNRVDPEAAELLGKEQFEFVVPRGGPWRIYRPLDDEGLWLRFAQTCRDADGVLSFANGFGRLGQSREGLDDRLDHILGFAARIRSIAECLQAGERLAATKLFNDSLPTMKEGILWYANQNNSTTGSFR